MEKADEEVYGGTLAPHKKSRYFFSGTGRLVMIFVTLGNVVKQNKYPTYIHKGLTMSNFPTKSM